MHWCKDCKIFIPSNQAQKEQHEFGSRHRRNRDENIAAAHKRRADAKRAEQAEDRMLRAAGVVGVAPKDEGGDEEPPKKRAKKAPVNAMGGAGAAAEALARIRGANKPESAEAEVVSEPAPAPEPVLARVPQVGAWGVVDAAQGATAAAAAVAHDEAEASAKAKRDTAKAALVALLSEEKVAAPAQPLTGAPVGFKKRKRKKA